MGDEKYVRGEIGGKSTSSGVDRAIARLAERQYGVVARAQLSELGLGAAAIDHRLRLGRLHPLYRGVYAVGQRKLPREARWMAAVLAGGPGAVLSHRAAAAHWRMAPDRGNVELVAPCRRRRPGISIHQVRLPPDEITTHEGIPVTTVPRTLFDLAAVVPQRRLERALNEAEVLRLWDELTLDRLLERYPRRKGNRAVRAVLRNRREGATLTRSELEEMFLRLVDTAGLPRPELNVLVEGYTVDALWREQRLVVELDGRGAHGTVAAFERDRERDRVLQVAGWRPVRITGRQLRLTPRAVIADVRRLLAVHPGRLAA
jgi:very-short-patch-repair endonuclease